MWLSDRIMDRRNVTASTDAARAHQAQADDGLDAQLAQLEDRLVAQYTHHGQHTEAEVREHFRRAAQHFLNAQVRSFLPILIEHAVKAKLT
jgi:hypothetical protein